MMKMFIKAADVSNETRPMDVAEPWLECLLQEFFQQVYNKLRHFVYCEACGAILL